MKQRQQLEQHLIEKAMKDPEFRKRLIENPKAVIQEVTGVELPPSFNLSILEEDPQTVYLVLPCIPTPLDEMELTENELEMVAGGRAEDSVLICTVFGCPPPGDPGG